LAQAIFVQAVRLRSLAGTRVANPLVVMLTPMMEGISALVAAGKAWAFPASAILLCLYPAIILAWTAVEGACSSAQSDVERQKTIMAPDIKKPRSAGRRRAAPWLVVVVCTVAAVASGSAFAVARHRASAQPLPTSAPAVAPETSATAPRVSAASASSLQPAGVLAGVVAVAAAAAGLRRRGNQTRAVPATSVVPVLGASRLAAASTGFTSRRGTARSAAAAAVAAPTEELVLPEGVRRYVAPAPTGHSLWHDVELHVKGWLDEDTGLYRYVNEMPMGSLQKFEVQPHLPENAIEEDPKGSVKLAAFGRPVPFNYGCLPQTYRDPDELDTIHSAPGDDDPLDIFDLGDHVAGVGEVVQCRPLGAVCLIDEGQADWKVLAVSTGHGGPLSEARSIADVERIVPGRVAECLQWLDDLKQAGGKGEAHLHPEIHGVEFAVALIERDHKSWRALVAEAKQTGTARGHWVRTRDASRRPTPMPPARFGMPWTLPRGLKGTASAPSVFAGMQHAEALLAQARATGRSASPSSPVSSSRPPFPSSP